MKDPYLDSLLELLANETLDADGPHLITVDELRAAGALDVPAKWRKTLAVERDLFPVCSTTMIRSPRTSSRHSATRTGDGSARGLL